MNWMAVMNLLRERKRESLYKLDGAAHRVGLVYMRGPTQTIFWSATIPPQPDWSPDQITAFVNALLIEFDRVKKDLGG